MNREKSFFKNTLIITIGRICTQLVTFFLLPLYTGILSTEEYGTVDLLNTLVSLLLPIVTFQVELAVFRELLDNRTNEKKQVTIISSGVISVAIQCLLYFVVFLIISPFIHNQYKIFLLVNVFASIFASLFLQITRGVGDNKKYAVASFLSAFSTVLFNILFLVVIKLRVTGMLLGTLIGQLICIVYIFITIKLYKYIKVKSFNKKCVKALWCYSLPLVPNSISWWVFNASDRLIVSLILGLSYTGLLSAANKFPSIITTLYNIFYLSFSENILSHTKDIDIEEYYNKIFNIILGLFLSLSVGMIACVPFAFPIMINSKFYYAYNLIPILVLANIFNIIVSMVGVVYSAHRNTKAIANTSIVAAVVNVIVHLLLIKFIGLYAAVVSTFVSYLVMAIYRLYTSAKLYFKIKINKDILLKTLLVLIITLSCYYLNNIYMNIISLIIAIIYALDINKKSFNSIIKIVLKNKMRG